MSWKQLTVYDWQPFERNRDAAQWLFFFTLLPPFFFNFSLLTAVLKGKMQFNLLGTDRIIMTSSLYCIVLYWHKATCYSNRKGIFNWFNMHFKVTSHCELFVIIREKPHSDTWIFFHTLRSPPACGDLFYISHSSIEKWKHLHWKDRWVWDNVCLNCSIKSMGGGNQK